MKTRRSWAKETLRRIEARNAKCERESCAAENTISITLTPDLSGFTTAMQNLTDAMLGRKVHGTRYYSTRDGRMHRRLGHAPLLHNGRKPKR